MLFRLIWAAVDMAIIYPIVRFVGRPLSQESLKKLNVSAAFWFVIWVIFPTHGNLAAHLLVGVLSGLLMNPILRWFWRKTETE